MQRLEQLCGVGTLNEEVKGGTVLVNKSQNGASGEEMLVDQTADLIHGSLEVEASFPQVNAQAYIYFKQDPPTNTSTESSPIYLTFRFELTFSGVLPFP